MYNLILNNVHSSVTECKATLFFFSAFSFGLVACNNVFVFILYSTLRQNKSLHYEDDKRYFFGCLAQVIISSVLMGMIMDLVPYKLTGCTWEPDYLAIPLSLGGFCLVVQIIMIAVTMKRVKDIVDKSKDEYSRGDKRLLVLSGRLVLVFFFQSFAFFPVYITETIYGGNINQIVTGLYIKFAGGMMDAVVLTVTNRALMKKIIPKILNLYGSSNSSSSGNGSVLKDSSSLRATRDLSSPKTDSSGSRRMEEQRFRQGERTVSVSDEPV